ncbi:MAG TPA: SRPBCC domain-containing protein [Polyangiaceae bacterium]
MSKKDTRDIELSVELDASPEDVFRAVTDGTEIAKWLAPEARATPPEGGKKGRVWISWGGGMDAEHEIDVYEAPKRIRHPSGKNGETKAPLYADWSIEAREGGKATLRLVHSGFSTGADWDDEYESHKRGWMLMLQNLRHYFARHPHQPTAHLPFMSSIESPRASIWKSLVGKLGFSGTPKVGDSFRFTTPKGDVLTGVVDLVTDTRDLALVVREYDDALLRFTMEGKADAPSTFLYAYVITYGAQRGRANELLAAARSATGSADS